MLCVTQEQNGTIKVANPQPADTSTCGLVVLSGAEALAVHEPFRMSTADAATLAVAMIGLVAVGWVSRQLIRFLTTL